MAGSDLERTPEGIPTARTPETAQPTHIKKPRISEDEKRLLPDYGVPPDSTALPTPEQFAYPPLPNMRPAKPGQGQSYKPLDTITPGASTPARKPSVRTYGNQKRTSMYEGQRKFIEQKANFGQLGPPSAFSNTSNDSSRPSKRRKTSNDSLASHDIITLDDDEPAPAFCQDGRNEASDILRRSASLVPRSQRSTGHISGSQARSGRFPVSSFQQTNQISEPRRKKPRRQSQHSSATPLVDATPFAINAERAGHGLPSHEPARRMSASATLSGLLASLPKQASDDELHLGEAVTTSRHFAPNLNGSNRNSPSSRRRPGTGSDIQGTRRQQPRNLRDTFRRVPESGVNDDVDELGEMWPPRPDPIRSTNMKHTESVQQTTSYGKRRFKEQSSPGWRLEYVRSYDVHEAGDDLMLVPKPDGLFQIQKTVKLGDVDMVATIDMTKVNVAVHDSVSRVRLKGSRSNATGDVYWFDLEFAKSEKFGDFCHTVVAPACQKVVTKDATYMESLFSKPLKSSMIHHEQAPTAAKVPSVTGNGVHQPPHPRPSLIGQLAPRKDDRSVEEIPRPKADRAQMATREWPNSARLRPARITRNSQATYIDDPDNYSPSVHGKEVRKFSEIHGLGGRWPKPVTYQSGRRRAVVNFDDLLRLDEGEFLNDALIDFYMIYAFEQAKVPPSKVYFFNTHFYTTLTRPVKGQKGLINYEGVKRWAKEDIFSYDYIVVPVCEEYVYC
ncbi:uncharacterized protein EI97DRAFT_202548 [Westerdykella ornata]|uniref:Ubiquitin-like protease family profile domain-containing protein n=1 Tax=Westerdykella ornata TaxID=318751 RepID=A0A6A6J8B7_WESOR|nr:uncharacterized protein EI97DRAFT_202548 [Westerdykella ornata]KAF2272662.1 hypothetical protein EI97DRAFT_202548 [Westerdykella ornata]